MRILSIALLALVILTACGPSGPTDPDPVSRTPSIDTAAWMARGLEVTNAAQQALGGELKAALERGGIDEAVPYCQVHALPITDSVAAVYDAAVSRTALRVRNPANEPTPGERTVLEAWRAQEDVPVPTIRLEDGTVLYHRPILMMPLCLQCHGTVGEDLTEADYDLITERYPDDQATGFSAGELRGMWTVAFPAE